MLCMLCPCKRTCGTFELLKSGTAAETGATGGQLQLASPRSGCNRLRKASTTGDPCRPVAGCLRPHDVGRHRLRLSSVYVLQFSTPASTARVA
jgi:hypothetical protein